MGAEHLEMANELWESIIDDDECCIGHPEGTEFVEGPIVRRMAAAFEAVDIPRPQLPPWTPLERCEVRHNATGEALDAVRAFHSSENIETWGNSRYTVTVRR